MFIEQPYIFLRVFYPHALWRKNKKEKVVYLTFDDGPIPEVTPWVLDVLRENGVKATFFCVGDNVRKHPDVFEMLKAEGHQVGNHTFNHIPGFFKDTDYYVENVEKADAYIHSKLLRPPHGHITRKQYHRLRKMGYRVVMWDLITRDYNAKLSPERILNNVKKYVRNGSIIVFHDSLKAEKNMRYAMPRAIAWLKEQGYEFGTL